MLSADQENDADVLGVDRRVHRAEPVAGARGTARSPAVRVGRVEGNWILNPTFQQLEFSTIDLVVSGSADSIVMVEGGALEVSEAEILEALKVAQKGIRELIGLQKKLIDKAGARPEDRRGPKPSPIRCCMARCAELAEAADGQAINAKDKAARASQA